VCSAIHKHQQVKSEFFRDIFNMGRRRNHHEASLTHELMAGEAGFAGEIYFSIDFQSN
jgi:hypothetical protein